MLSYLLGYLLDYLLGYLLGYILGCLLYYLLDYLLNSLLDYWLVYLLGYLLGDLWRSYQVQCNPAVIIGCSNASLESFLLADKHSSSPASCGHEQELCVITSVSSRRPPWCRLHFLLYFLVWPLLHTHCRCRRLLSHLITLNDTHSVGLLWMNGQPDAETSIWQHTTVISPVVFEPAITANVRP